MTASAPWLYIEDGTCQLISKKQIVYKSFTGLCSAMARLPVTNAIRDAVLKCSDSTGENGKFLATDCAASRN
jgi:hypothetical protein